MYLTINDSAIQEIIGILGKSIKICFGRFSSDVSVYSQYNVSLYSLFHKSLCLRV